MTATNNMSAMVAEMKMITRQQEQAAATSRHLTSLGDLIQTNGAADQVQQELGDARTALAELQRLLRESAVYLEAEMAAPPERKEVAATGVIVKSDGTTEAYVPRVEYARRELRAAKRMARKLTRLIAAGRTKKAGRLIADHLRYQVRAVDSALLELAKGLGEEAEL